MGWLSAVLGVLARLYELAKLGLAYFAGRRAAERDMEDETDRMEERADQVSLRVDGLTDEEVQAELRREWQRD